MNQNETFVVVRAFTSVPDAHVARSVLDAAGIPTRIADEHLVAADWLYSNAIGGVKLLVPDDRAVEAVAILDATATEVELPPYLSSADTTDRCRACGSEAFELVVQGRRWAALSWLLSGLPFIPVRRVYQCRNCGTPA